MQILKIENQQIAEVPEEEKLVDLYTEDDYFYHIPRIRDFIKEEEVNLKQTVRRIRALCEEYDVHTVVLGLPKNMNDTLGERAELTMAFQKRLQRDLYLVEVVLWDERLTTVSAHKILSDNNIRGKKRKAVVDAVSAVLILEDYMRTV